MADTGENRNGAPREILPGVLVHPTRMACTGSEVGPSLYHLLEVLGRDRVLQRLDAVLAKI